MESTFADKFSKLDYGISTLCSDNYYVSAQSRATVLWLEKYCPGLLLEYGEKFCDKLQVQNVWLDEHHPEGGALILALKNDEYCTETEFISEMQITESTFRRLRKAANVWITERI